MIRINQVKMHPGYKMGDVVHKVARQLHCSNETVKGVAIVRESLDARKKPDIYFQLTVDVTVEKEQELFDAFHKKQPGDVNVSLVKEQKYQFPACGNKPLSERPIIIGTGPAGLFCGYFLALRGFKPLLLERGLNVEKRKEDVEKFWETGVLDTESNVQFGEGGAGTFSDGKLNTMTKDKIGRNKAVLELFVQMGADEKILYQQKPHIGTDQLLGIVENIRNEIIRLGGEVRFESKMEEILTKDGSLYAVKLADGTELPGRLCILATGHSARDTFQMLLHKEVAMEAKSFAVGFRVQHSQEMINKSQYGTCEAKLPAANYKVTAQTKSGRGVYSFCMCPGGYVVNASSEEGGVCVNGMSYSGRDGANANSAIIVSVTPEDFDKKDALSGVRFQRQLEEKAFSLAKGKIPVQLYGDFKENKESTKVLGTSVEVKGEYALTNLRPILPEALNEAFVEGMTGIGRKIKGFDAEDVILCGVESRTSSPLRILRNETLMSNIEGLYPCGEGAGYAGGITSAAVDGIRVAEQIVSTYDPSKM